MNRSAPRKYFPLLTGLLIAMAFMAFQCQTEEFPQGEQLLTSNPPETEEGPQFVPYDTPPEPIGGYAAIRQNLDYPDDARQEGVEGTVVLQLKVLSNGQTGETVAVLLNESEDPRLAQAAVEAVRNLTWKPAMSKGEAVSVWVSIPVNFRLGD